MARRTPALTQSDVTRLIKGAIAAGVNVERMTGIKMTREGVVVLFGDPEKSAKDTGNEWDEVLDGAP